MNWNDLTFNPKVILGYFDEAPSIENIEIFRVVLSRDASTVEIVFEPTTFPERAPKKWPIGANAAQITLRLSEVSSLLINGWASNVLGDLIVVQVRDLIAVTFIGDVVFEAECACVEVTQVVGYTDTRRANATEPQCDPLV